MDLERAKLIELVQQFPQLWNKRHLEFRDKTCIENAWKTISNIMEVPMDDCQTVWNSIRTRFIRERKIYRSLPTGTGRYTSKWPYYELCGFLEEAISTRKTKGNILKSSLPIPTRELWEEHLLLDDGEEAELIEQNETFEETHSPLNITQDSDNNMENVREDIKIVPSTSAASPVFINSTPIPPRKTMRVVRNKDNNKGDNSTLVNTCSELGNKISQMIAKNQGQQTDSDNYHFGLSIAKSLDNIKSKKRQAMLKARIYNLIAEAESDTD